MEVIGSFAKKHTIRIALKKGTKIDVGRSDITSINPGKRDHVYIGKFEGKSQYIQKQYLLRKLRDV